MKIRSKQELVDLVDSGERVKFVFFWGHKNTTANVTKSCLSQWFNSPFDVDGNAFQTAEHYMMYEKAKLFGDSAAAGKVLLASSPGEAKSIGREVLEFDQSVWEDVRFEIVVAANLAKFGGSPELKKFLLNTGNRVLVEASPVDKIWGIGMSADDPMSENPNEWLGQNLLGFALMEVRDLLAR